MNKHPLDGARPNAAAPQTIVTSLVALAPLVLLLTVGCDTEATLGDAGRDSGTDAGPSPELDASPLDAGGDASPPPCTLEVPSTSNALAEAFVGLWNIDDDAERRCVLESVWAEDAEYVSSAGTLRGRDALASHLASTRAGVRALTSGAPVHHEGLRFTWSVTGGAGESGISLAELDASGRMVRVVSYSGPPATLEELGPYEAYVAAWNETSPTARAALLDRVWAEDGVYIDPTVDARGREALSSVIQDYLNNFDERLIVIRTIGSRFERTFWVTWAIRDLADDTDLVLGMDFCELTADGSQLQRLFSFFGDVPPVGFGGNRGDCLSCFERQLVGGNPADLCTTGTPTSVDLDNAINGCVCATACTAQCGDNLCMGMAPSAECGGCLSNPGHILEACPVETDRCWADG